MPLETAVFQALGAASACWEDLDRAGVFESDRAKQVGDRLVEYLVDLGTLEQQRLHGILWRAMEAFRLTREYVAPSVYLYAVPGWSWWEATLEMADELGIEPVVTPLPNDPAPVDRARTDLERGRRSYDAKRPETPLAPADPVPSLERLYATTDAQVWAEEFAKVAPAVDGGLMLAWFANAIETGRRFGRDAQ